VPGPFGTAQNPQYLHHGNPIEFTARLIEALGSLEKQLADKPPASVEGLSWPKPTIAIVGISSVGWISNVPERCDLQVWANVIPPMSSDEFRQAVAACVHQQARGIDWFEQNPPAIQWGPIDVPSLVTPMDSPFYRALGDAHAASFGTALVPRLIGGWGDMRLLGCSNALFYGPGAGANCHGYDEYYRLDDLNPMLKSLLYLAAGWCGVR
jgi:acetylornithine deacetylase/succinyl-diaminopimelate desuccinylase-like protein